VDYPQNDRFAKFVTSEEVIHEYASLMSRIRAKGSKWTLLGARVEVSDRRPSNSFFLQEGIDGHVTGVDLWDAKDQSQSSAVAALENARKEDVRMYVEVRTADARELPFLDASFDLVVSSLCIHNIGEGLGRYVPGDAMSVFPVVSSFLIFQ
jgi:hypothetical protein